MLRRPTRDKPPAPPPVFSAALHIAVVDSGDVLTTRLTELFADLPVVHVDHVDDAIKGAIGPTVVVIGPDAMSEATLLRVEELRDIAPAPSLCVVLAVARMSTGVLRRALRAGISDVASATSDEELTDVIRRATSRVKQALPSDAIAAAPGRIVAVFSPKGGVGTTTVAVNLANTPRSDGRPHVIVDADLPFGDVAVSLGIDPSSSLADATGPDLDLVRLRSLFSHQEGRDVLALAAPADPARAELITAADVVRTLELCRQFASLVVVDTASAFDDVTLAVLEVADDIVLVAGTDVASVKNARIALQTMRQLDVASDRIQLVLNRVPSHPTLSVADIEKALGHKAACIAEDAAVTKASDRATAVVVERPRAAASRALAQLAERLGLSSASAPAA